MTDLRALPTRCLSIGFLLFTASAGLTLLLALPLVPGPLLKTYSDLPIGIFLLLFLGWAGIFLAHRSWNQNRSRAFVSTGVIAFALVALALILTPFQTRNYGDANVIPKQIAMGVPSTRWLAGEALLIWLYDGIWRLPSLFHALPMALQSSQGFLKVAGILCMLVGTLFILRRWSFRLSVLLPIMTPIWLLFASGYLEYYPVIAGIFLAYLALTLHSDLSRLSVYQAGVLAALPPAFYVGFAPVGAVFLLAWGKARLRELPAAAGCSLLAYFVLIALAWDKGVSSYFRTLHGQMNFGEANLFFEPFRGRSAGPQSIFFQAGYALSPEHLRYSWYMLFWGLGWLVPASLVAVTILMAREPGGRKLLKEGFGRAWPALILIAWQVFYFIFMIPKFGPRLDVDLFFTTYLALAFLAGALWQGWASRSGNPAAVKFLVLCAVAGNTAVASLFLLALGLPELG